MAVYTVYPISSLDTVGFSARTGPGAETAPPYVCFRRAEAALPAAYGAELLKRGAV